MVDEFCTQKSTSQVTTLMASSSILTTKEYQKTTNKPVIFFNSSKFFTLNFNFLLFSLFLVWLFS